MEDRGWRIAGRWVVDRGSFFVAPPSWRRVRGAMIVDRGEDVGGIGGNLTAGEKGPIPLADS